MMFEISYHYQSLSVLLLTYGNQILSGNIFQDGITSNYSNVKYFFADLVCCKAFEPQ